MRTADSVVATVYRWMQAREARLYLVGGFLRDRLLGRSRETANLDFAVERGAVATAQAFAREHRGHFVPLDEQFGSARVVLTFGEQQFELDFTDWRGPTIEADLAARDFTINAMAVALPAFLQHQPLAEAVMDPLGGLADLRERRMRGTSAQALMDDPVRIVRGVGLAAELDFHLDAQTLGWMRPAAAGLADCAGERITEAFFRALPTPRAARAVEQLGSVGALEVMIPELATCRGVEQGRHHPLDVWGHQLETVRQLDAFLHAPAPWPAALEPPVRAYLEERLSAERPRAALLKLAALCHDLGKPATKTVDQRGRMWFIGHERLGAGQIAAVADRLHLSGKEREMLRRTVLYHLRPGFLARDQMRTRRAIFRFFRDAEQEAPGILLMWMADRLAHGVNPDDPEEPARQRVIITELLAHYFLRPEEIAKPPVLLDGHQVMALLDLPPGPRVGRLLRAIAEAQAEGLVTTPDEAAALARRLHAQWP